MQVQWFMCSDIFHIRDSRLMNVVYDGLHCCGTGFSGTAPMFINSKKAGNRNYNPDMNSVTSESDFLNLICGGIFFS